MKSREMKVNKNVTLTMTNIKVITQMMDKTHKNFSQALNVIVTDWLEIRTTLHFNKEQKKLQVEKEAALNRMKTATVIKE